MRVGSLFGERVEKVLKGHLSEASPFRLEFFKSHLLNNHTDLRTTRPEGIQSAQRGPVNKCDRGVRTCTVTTS